MSEPTSFSEFLANVPPPPGWAQWISALGVGIAIITLLFRLVTYYAGRRQRLKDQRTSRLDDYWLRQVILPLCVNPLIALAESISSDILDLHRKKPSSAKKRQVLRDIAEKRAVLSQGSKLLVILNRSLLDRFEENLDDIEDNVANHVNLIGVQLNTLSPEDKILANQTFACDFVWQRTQDTIELIMEHHKNLSA